MNGGGIPGIPSDSQHTTLRLSYCHQRTWWREAWHAHRWPTHWRSTHTVHTSHRSTREASAQVRLIQRICLSFQVVRVRYTIDNLLCLVARYLFIVGLHVSEVVATIVVRFPYAHAVVGEIDIAVVAKEFRHCGVFDVAQI
jgi:hypothetical protein